ncbi:hypothetical protein CY652_08860 [Burkholderia sp. WAC0059]|nr:hypothetical protein CY652_08860 [Burkholderia sp. WAC0059]
MFQTVLRYAAVFFTLAIIAVVSGFGGMAAGTAALFVFPAIFLAALPSGVVRLRYPRPCASPPFRARRHAVAHSAFRGATAARELNGGMR